MNKSRSRPTKYKIIHFMHYFPFCKTCADSTAWTGMRITRLRLDLAALILGVVGISLVLYTSVAKHYFLKFTYMTRPLWDKRPKGCEVIPHYASPGLSVSEECALHGWEHTGRTRRIVDAILFSVEVELLEVIRPGISIKTLRNE